MRISAKLLVALCAALVLTGAAAHARPYPTSGTTPVPSSARPTYDEYTYERVRVPMRDGVELSADIWRPVTPEGVEVPVILSLTPYHVLYRALDTREEDLPVGDARLFVPKGYAYVLADVRGTYGSGGCWNYGGLKERHDGYDLVEWLGTREWSNGKVAMTGGSYDGTTANAAAVERPPHLATIIPISAISRWWGYAYQQGARSTYSGESADIDPPSDTPTDFMFAYGFIPPPDPGTLTAAQQIAMRWRPCNRIKKFMHGYDTDPDYTSFWMRRDYLHLADRVDVPVLISHGQLDFNVKTWEGTQWFEALKTEKMMILGQWPHASPRGRFQDWDLLLERWLERWLYGVRNGVEHEPSVHIQTNDGKWHAQDTWRGTPRRYDLEGEAVTFFDDGLLTESEMTRGVTPSRYVRVAIPETEGVAFEGRPVLHLSASSDRPSTHLVAILCDSTSSGGCSVISRGFMNARYRETLREGKDLEPGKRYTFDLEFIDKGYDLAEGHHLELIIASSSNTWVAPDQQRATNTLILDDSWLELPVRR
ncbi:MAG: CocE/NonD family hydrolase [Actinomycetota bacterium]|nr:CocE/NonD family hydrolase [Actinomycetota bacterium]